MSRVEEIIEQVLSQAENLAPRINEMQLAEAEDFYSIVNQMAKLSTENIQCLSDTSSRVKLCKLRDLVLARIVDIPELSIQCKELKGELFSPYAYNWEFLFNEALLKDVGLVPYLLARELRIKPNMLFFDKNTEYPYLDFLPEMNIIYENYDSDIEKRHQLFLEYMEKNSDNCDVLTLYGPYPSCLEIALLYKKIKPQGKIYMSLDMNRDWRKKINWGNSVNMLFFGSCHTIATSCRSLCDLLNSDPNVNFECFWIPNGFYNAYKVPVVAKPENKENIILTVGRLGTEQKNNEELLIAFARVADSLPDWKCHLVGSVDDRIQPFLSYYFETFPHLKERVIFRGKITDKAELYREYANAKIFILTSRFEGGTPNVYAEALNHGCYFITSNIDGADDVTNYGELGQEYPCGYPNALAKILLSVCPKLSTEFFKTHIPSALDYANRYYDWNKNAKKIAYTLFH